MIRGEFFSYGRRQINLQQLLLTHLNVLKFLISKNGSKDIILSWIEITLSYTLILIDIYWSTLLMTSTSLSYFLGAKTPVIFLHLKYFPWKILSKNYEFWDLNLTLFNHESFQSDWSSYFYKFTANEHYVVHSIHKICLANHTRIILLKIRGFWSLNPTSRDENGQERRKRRANSEWRPSEGEWYRGSAHCRHYGAAVEVRGVSQDIDGGTQHVSYWLRSWWFVNQYF